MQRVARNLAACGLLAFTGALFISATTTPPVTCNLELLIDPYLTYHWRCTGDCPPSEPCKETGFPWGDGWMIYCWCPQSTRIAMCPGGIAETASGDLVPTCIYLGATCNLGHICKTNLTFSSEYYSDICKCEPEE